MKENNNKICREMKINHFHVKHKLFIYPPFTLHGEEPLFLCRKMEIVHMQILWILDSLDGRNVIIGGKVLHIPPMVDDCFHYGKSDGQVLHLYIYILIIIYYDKRTSGEIQYGQLCRFIHRDDTVIFLDNVLNIGIIIPHYDYAYLDFSRISVTIQ